VTPSGEREPPSLQIHPTRRCNLACRHCYTNSGPSFVEQLPIQILIGVLGDARSLGYEYLAISGGEPLLYRGLPALLDVADQLGFTTTVTTNAALVTERSAAMLANVDAVAVSIDGDPSGHDGIRGAGSFASVRRGLARLEAAGARVGIITTLTMHNVDQLESIVSFACTAGARFVQVHPLTAQGRARDEMADAVPDEIELAAAIAEAGRLTRQFGLPVRVDANRLDDLITHPDACFVDAGSERFVDFIPQLIVSADGTVLPLTAGIDRTFALGNLYTEHLSAMAPTWWEQRGDEFAAHVARTFAALLEEQPTITTWHDRLGPTPVERDTVDQ
jgi:MoaA/NifB/PqqE/SkfB family radical SAM enzyme